MNATFLYVKVIGSLHGKIKISQKLDDWELDLPLCYWLEYCFSDSLTTQKFHRFFGFNDIVNTADDKIQKDIILLLSD